MKEVPLQLHCHRLRHVTCDRCAFPKDVLLPPPLVSFAMFVEAVPFVVSAGWQGLIFVGQQLEDGRAVPAKPLVGIELNPGPTICQHGKQKNKCKECGGSGICKHFKQKSLCKECGGSSICQHGKQKNKCKDCGGSGICEHGKQRGQCKDCKGMAVLSGIAAAVPRRYYPDRKEYSLLDEYVVAEGCDEREVMEQISFGEQGDFLFDDVYDTSFGDRKLVPYAPLIICCVPSTKAAFKLILRRCSRRSLPPPPNLQVALPSKARGRRRRSRREERVRHPARDAAAVGTAAVRSSPPSMCRISCSRRCRPISSD